jgi:hypothetical protein
MPPSARVAEVALGCVRHAARSARCSMHTGIISAYRIQSCTLEKLPHHALCIQNGSAVSDTPSISGLYPQSFPVRR